MDQLGLGVEEREAVGDLKNPFLDLEGGRESESQPDATEAGRERETNFCLVEIDSAEHFSWAS